MLLYTVSLDLSSAMIHWASKMMVYLLLVFVCSHYRFHLNAIIDGF